MQNAEDDKESRVEEIDDFHNTIVPEPQIKQEPFNNADIQFMPDLETPPSSPLETRVSSLLEKKFSSEPPVSSKTVISSERIVSSQKMESKILPETKFSSETKPQSEKIQVKKTVQETTKPVFSSPNNVNQTPSPSKTSPPKQQKRVTPEQALLHFEKKKSETIPSPVQHQNDNLTTDKANEVPEKEAPIITPDIQNAAITSVYLEKLNISSSASAPDEKIGVFIPAPKE